MVPRLSSGRTALFLYVLLVVLPAVVFGGLLWRQLRKDQARQLASIPADCDDAAERLSIACAQQVTSLLDGQHELPFEYFRQEYYSEQNGIVELRPSPLARGRRATGVLGWFSFRATGPNVAEAPEITVVRGGESAAGVVPQDGPDTIELVEVVRVHIDAAAENLAQFRSCLGG